METRIERTCPTCDQPFWPLLAQVKTGKGKYCSRACANLGRRVDRKEGVRHRQTRAKGHPIAPASGIVPIGRLKLYDKIGGGPHPCHWCRELVDWKPGVGVSEKGVLVVDHLDLDPTNDDLSNLVPSCNQCNAHRRITGRSALIRNDELVVVARSGQRHRAIERECEFCGRPFLAIPAQFNSGKGRFCSRSCARRKPQSTPKATA